MSFVGLQQHSLSTNDNNRPCGFCCGDECNCGEGCACTETLCRCEASSVLNSVSPITKSKKKLQQDPMPDLSLLETSVDSTTTPENHESSFRNTDSAEFYIDGMTCTMCSQAIERAVQALPGIESIAISLASDSAVISWHSSTTTAAQIQQAIEDVGYTVQQIVYATNDNDNNNDSVLETVQERWQRLEQRQTEKVAARRRAFLWSLVGTVPILVLTMIVPHNTPLARQKIHLGPYTLSLEATVLWILATPVQFLAGWEFYKMAWYGIMAGRAGMDVLIALGTSASYGYALYGVWTGDAGLAHFFETSAVLICFVLLGKWMQALAVRRTSQALHQLMELQAKTAIKVMPLNNQNVVNFHPGQDPYREETLPIEEIHANDIVKVIRGASIPADGKILFGEIAVDESMVTGESLPVLKTPGSVVLGGTVCVESSSDSSTTTLNDDVGGAAFVQVTGVGSATALAQIVQLVQQAQTRAVPIQSFADQVSAVFVPTVCSISVVTFLVWYALCSSNTIPSDWYQGEDPMTFSLMFAIACLVISCPCALGLATPTAVMVGTGVSAKIGVLMKGGEALEIASKVDSVVFDKTGTLTLGKPAVSDFLRLGDQDDEKEEELLWLLGTLERSSEHPLARAVVQFAEERLGDKLKEKPFGQPTQFRAMTGRGATGKIGNLVLSVGNRAFAEALGYQVPFVAEECMVSLEEDGKTAILVLVDGVVTLVLGVTDQIKDDAAASIAYLRNELGVDVWMVTGDNSRTARAVGNQLGLAPERVISEALPAAKLEKVRKLQAEGHVVAMIGDGVNDSPALAQADVGMSLGTGAEIANEASDIVLVKGHVSDVCTALDLSRVIFNRIKWNFLWSLIYNCLGIPVAAGVLYPLIRARLPPTLAALAMALSSISVVLSSLSLRLYQPPKIVVPQERSNHRRRPRVAPPAVSEDNELEANLLENDHLENDHLEASEVTDTTEPTDNRTLSLMEEGEA